MAKKTTPKKTTPKKDSPELAAIKAKVLECDKAKWIAEAKSKLLIKRASLLPYTDKVLCDKCGQVISEPQYHQKREPYCADPYQQRDGSYFYSLFSPCNSGGEVECLSWLCDCGRAMFTKTKDAKDA